jgi:nifR3 family TIM-barrel protein
MKDFWKQLNRPFFVLAPMEDVTDAAFRALISRYGKPGVMMTEFTSADGLVRADEAGQKKLRKKLLYTNEEHPIVAQLFSASPENMEKASKMCADLGFDGIDINMGCPVDEVVRQRCGAAMIKNHPLAREVIRAAKKSGLPVSVKTRIGYNTDELDTWLSELLAEDLSAITIHARTRKEMSDVPAKWDRVAHAVSIRNSLKSETLIVGNGDVKDMNDARAKVVQTNCDGVMLGRAIYGNPWLFSGRETEPTSEEKKSALAEHLRLFDQFLTGNTNFAVMKKHFKAYISGWDGAKDLRIQLMDTESVKEALALLT